MTLTLGGTTAVAFQRLDDGEALLTICRPRAAIYLTGYAVECILKALLLTSTPAGERPEVLATFRGAVAHNIDWLRDRLVQRIGRLPVNENRHLSLVSSWSTVFGTSPARAIATTRRHSSSPPTRSSNGPTVGCELWPQSFEATPTRRCRPLRPRLAHMKPNTPAPKPRFTATTPVQFACA